MFTPEKEYRAAIEKKALDNTLGKYVASFHWDLYLILSFRTEVSDEYARRSGIEFIQKFGDLAYGFVFWGEGYANSRMHIHVLLGGIQPTKRPRFGLNLRALNLRKARRVWEHGVVKKSEIYNPRKRAAFYLPTHHDFDLEGDCKRHRMRRKVHTRNC